jgi:hypothetical protein
MTLIPNLLNPITHILKCGSLCDIIEHESTNRESEVVEWSWGLLLWCLCIPDLYGENTTTIGANHLAKLYPKSISLLQLKIIVHHLT